ncbi:MAG: hypothetical protein ACPIOQ_72305, partial [Promethearchaeia archaeon]
LRVRATALSAGAAVLVGLLECMGFNDGVGVSEHAQVSRPPPSASALRPYQQSSASPVCHSRNFRDSATGHLDLNPTFPRL